MSDKDDPPWTVEEGREYVRKEAEPSGLERECIEAYDSYIKTGDTPERASWCALYDWDV